MTSSKQEPPSWAQITYRTMTMLCLVAQLCPTLCDPLDCCLLGSSVHGDSPGRNTGVGYHALLQGIFPTLGLNPGLPRCRWILYQLRYNRTMTDHYKYVWSHWALELFVTYIGQSKQILLKAGRSGQPQHPDFFPQDPYCYTFERWVVWVSKANTGQFNQLIHYCKTRCANPSARNRRFSTHCPSQYVSLASSTSVLDTFNSCFLVPNSTFDFFNWTEDSFQKGLSTEKMYWFTWFKRPDIILAPGSLTRYSLCFLRIYVLFKSLSSSLKLSVVYTPPHGFSSYKFHIITRIPFKSWP